MGQREIKDLLKSGEFMTSKEINKALENLGYIIGINSTRTNIRALNKYGFLEQKERDCLTKEYRLKDKYI